MESGLQAESVANDGYDCRRVLHTRRVERRRKGMTRNARLRENTGLGEDGDCSYDCRRVL